MRRKLLAAGLVSFAIGVGCRPASDPVVGTYTLDVVGSKARSNGARSVAIIDKNPSTWTWDFKSDGSFSDLTWKEHVGKWSRDGEEILIAPTTAAPIIDVINGHLDNIGTGKAAKEFIVHLRSASEIEWHRKLSEDGETVVFVFAKRPRN